MSFIKEKIKSNIKTIIGIMLFIFLIPYINILINSIFTLGRVVGSLTRYLQ